MLNFRYLCITSKNFDCGNFDFQISLKPKICTYMLGSIDNSTISCKFNGHRFAWFFLILRLYVLKPTDYKFSITHVRMPNRESLYKILLLAASHVEFTVFCPPRIAVAQHIASCLFTACSIETSRTLTGFWAKFHEIFRTFLAFYEQSIFIGTLAMNSTIVSVDRNLSLALLYPEKFEQYLSHLHARPEIWKKFRPLFSANHIQVFLQIIARKLQHSWTTL